MYGTMTKFNVKCNFIYFKNPPKFHDVSKRFTEIVNTNIFKFSKGT